MTDNESEFDRIVGGVDGDKVVAAEVIERLRGINENVVGPYIDEVIKMASDRRVSMLLRGFTTQDVSYMFESLLDRSIALLGQATE
jgi:hypothetical protein